MIPAVSPRSPEPLSGLSKASGKTSPGSRDQIGDGDSSSTIKSNPPDARNIAIEDKNCDQIGNDHRAQSKALLGTVNKGLVHRDPLFYPNGDHTENQTGMIQALAASPYT